MKPIKALLIEDNPADTRLIREMLADASGVQCELEYAGRLSDALGHLPGEVDIILLDLSLPDSHGLETFARVHAGAPQSPIVVLSGLDDEELATKAVRYGAQDYLVKGQFDSHLLVHAIQYAIERKRAEAEIRRRAAHLEALNAIIVAAAAAPDLPTLLETALDHTLRALGLDIGAAWLEDARALCGPRPDLGTITTQIERISDVGVALEGIPAPFAVEDWQRAPGDGPPSALALAAARLGVRASLIVPISIPGQRGGGLAVASLAPRPWSAEEIALVEAIARQLGTTAERLRLFQTERKERELAEALREAAATVSSTLDLDQVLDRILEQVERVVPGDAFNILLVEDGTAQVARRRGYETIQGSYPPLTARYQIDQFPTLLQMAETGEPVVIPDTSADPGWVPLEGPGWLRSYVAAPIRVSGLTVGFLNVNSIHPNRFDLDDAHWLLAFANHAASAIHNARLYRELRNYATQLEQRVRERTAQLQAQYARLEAILHSASDGIVVVNADGEIIQANPIADAWLTYALSSDDIARLRSALGELAQQAEKRPERTLQLKGLDLQLRAAPIVDPDAEDAATVVVIHDISHLKALDRMKAEFISNVSHELRTPITTVKLYAALLRQAPPEKASEYLDALTQEADRQARLLEDILQVSVMDAGRLELKPRLTSLGQLTDFALAGRQALAQERGISLEYSPATTALTVMVDRDRIVQAILNLVTNAITYTPAGGKVTVAVGEKEADGHTWATVTVTDTGIGIPENELSRIFERFYRGNKARLMQVPGTGLGLAIAKEIVELHGGRITVESQVDVGSTFTVWLPLVVDDSGHAGAQVR